MVMHHSMTMSDTRRDFRWVRQSNERTPPCVWPYVELKSPIMGGDCLQFLWWSSTKVQEVDGVYKVTPPEPKTANHWVGYHVEVSFKGDTEHLSILKNDFIFTTPGYTWPNTLPFPDCNSNEGTCIEQ